MYKLELAHGLAGAERRAEAWVMMRDFDRAAGYLERVLADSVFYTPAILRLAPIWDLLRERANFKKLVPEP